MLDVSVLDDFLGLWFWMFLCFGFGFFFVLFFFWMIFLVFWFWMIFVFVLGDYFGFAFG